MAERPIFIFGGGELELSSFCVGCRVVWGTVSSERVFDDSVSVERHRACDGARTVRIIKECMLLGFLQYVDMWILYA